MLKLPCVRDHEPLAICLQSIPTRPLSSLVWVRVSLGVRGRVDFRVIKLIGQIRFRGSLVL